MYLLYDIGLTDDAMEALLNRASELSDEEAAVVAVCRPGLILVRPFQGLGQKILGEGSRSGRGVVGVMHGFVDGDCYYPAVNSICLPSLFIATRNLMRKCGKIQPMVRKR